MNTVLELIILALTIFVEFASSDQPLILTPLIEAGKFEEARSLSRVHAPQLKYGGESYAGYLTVNKIHNSNLFFWFFKNKNPEAPVLVWFNGGPGVSAMYGLFEINGPFRITEQLVLKCRKYTWTKPFSMLYIDNPIGAGFSFTDNELGYSRDLNDATINLFKALKQFFTLFSELKDNDFYITGESYAGKFIVAEAYKMYDENQKFTNFKGIAVGDGFIDPISHLGYGALFYEFGLIDERQKQLFDEKEKEIKTLIEDRKFEEALKKWNALNSMFGDFPNIFRTFTGYDNYYDMRFSTDKSHSQIEKFLNKRDIREALHVGNKPFDLGVSNDSAVINHMQMDLLSSAKQFLPLVMNNYKVMLYAGNMDLVLPPVIAFRFVRTLDWKHKNEYFNATRKVWKVRDGDKQVAGYVKHVENYYEVTVRNAGHSVPADQPKAAFDMITKFVTNQL